MRTLIAGAALALMSTAPAVAAPHEPLEDHGCHVLRRPELDALDEASWYLPTADGKARLYVTELGCGDPILFLHGGPGNDFHYFIPALRSHLKNHRFILLEQRGSLLSPVPQDDPGALSLDKLVEDIETLRVAIGAKRLTILGHSWGTMLALFYAQRFPEHVSRLILTGVIQSHARGGLEELVAAMRPRQHKLLGRRIVATVEREVGLPEESRLDTPQEHTVRGRIAGNAAQDIVHVNRWRDVHGIGVWYNEKVANVIAGSVPASWDFRTIPPGVKIYIIQGDQDYADPAASTWRGLPGVDVRLLKDAGHYSWIDDPRRFGDDLEHALAR